MQAAAEQEEKIVALIAEQEATLREITRLRKGKGSGRPKREGLAGTDRHKRAAHELGRLKRDLLPGEPDGEAARTQEQLCAAVQHHAADHGAAGNATRAHHAQLRDEMWGDLRAQGAAAATTTSSNSPAGRQLVMTVLTRTSKLRANGAAAAAGQEDAGAAAARAAISLGDLPPVNPGWAIDPLKMDAFHFPAHLNAIATHQSNSLFGVFTVVLAMCVFKQVPGEYARVLKCTKKRYAAARGPEQDLEHPVALLQEAHALCVSRRRRDHARVCLPLLLEGD